MFIHVLRMLMNIYVFFIRMYFFFNIKKFCITHGLHRHFLQLYYAWHMYILLQVTINLMTVIYISCFVFVSVIVKIVTSHGWNYPTCGVTGVHVLQQTIAVENTIFVILAQNVASTAGTVIHAQEMLTAVKDFRFATKGVTLARTKMFRSKSNQSCDTNHCICTYSFNKWFISFICFVQFYLKLTSQTYFFSHDVYNITLYFIKLIDFFGVGVNIINMFL